MKFLLTPRFNHLDLVWMGTFTILLSQGRYLTALIVVVTGITINQILERVFATKSRDSEWQALSKAGKRVEAIRQHRVIYNTSLKESLNAVNAFEGRPLV